MNPLSQASVESGPSLSSKPTKAVCLVQVNTFVDSQCFKSTEVQMYNDSIKSTSTNTSAHSPPGTSASLARARILALHLEFQQAGTSLFLSSTLALRRRQGETLLSTKLLAPGNPGLFTVGPISCSAMRAKLMSCISCSDSPHDDAGRL